MSDETIGYYLVCSKYVFGKNTFESKTDDGRNWNNQNSNVGDNFDDESIKAVIIVM